MNIDEMMESFPFGILVIKDDLILHVANYQSEPTENDLYNLRDELATDKRFGLTELTDYEMFVGQGEPLKELLEELVSSDVIDLEMVVSNPGVLN